MFYDSINKLALLNEEGNLSKVLAGNWERNKGIDPLSVLSEAAAIDARDAKRRKVLLWFAGSLVSAIPVVGLIVASFAHENLDLTLSVLQFVGIAMTAVVMAALIYAGLSIGDEIVRSKSLSNIEGFCSAFEAFLEMTQVSPEGVSAMSQRELKALARKKLVRVAKLVIVLEENNLPANEPRQQFERQFASLKELGLTAENYDSYYGDARKLIHG